MNNYNLLRQSKGKYNRFLKRVCSQMGHCNTTFAYELDGMGKNLFGNNWRGIHTSDDTDFMRDMQDKNVAILNLDTSKGPGSHWIGVAKKDNQMIVYDSFGRQLSNIAPNINKSIVELIKDGTIKTKHETPCGLNAKYPCELKKETNCGQRVLAWMLTEKYNRQNN